MNSLVVSLLAQRPEAELQELRDKAQSELARLQVEIDQFDEALAKRSRRGGGTRQVPRPRTGRTTRGNTKKLVENIFKSQPDMDLSPAAVVRTLEEQGTPPSSPSAVYNGIRRLKEVGTILQVGEGLYRLASQNGAGQAPGPTENEEGEPLLTASPNSGGT